MLTKERVVWHRQLHGELFLAFENLVVLNLDRTNFLLLMLVKLNLERRDVFKFCFVSIVPWFIN